MAKGMPYGPSVTRWGDKVVLVYRTPVAPSSTFLYEMTTEKAAQLAADLLVSIAAAEVVAEDPGPVYLPMVL